MEKVSAVIPCYNDSEHLSDAIKSALNQTVALEEIIVVDDGSTEDINSVIENFTHRNRINLITHDENRGLPAARNTGIKNAEGDYIALLDADDEWVPEKIQKQMERFREEGTLGLVYSDHYRITPDGEVISVRRAPSPPERDFLKKAFIGGIGGILPSTVIIPKNCFEMIGYFDGQLLQAQEFDMFMRIGAEFDIARVSEPLVRRRVRSESLGSNKIQKIQYRREIITPKFVKKYPHLASLLGRREAYLMYLEASSLARSGDLKKARRRLIDSIRRYPWEWKAYARFFMTLLGKRGSKVASNKCQELKFKITNIKQKMKINKLIGGISNRVS